jgi:hypothetical protein
VESNEFMSNEGKYRYEFHRMLQPEKHITVFEFGDIVKTSTAKCNFCFPRYDAKNPDIPRQFSLDITTGNGEYAWCFLNGLPWEQFYENYFPMFWATEALCTILFCSGQINPQPVYDAIMGRPVRLLFTIIEPDETRSCMEYENPGSHCIWIFTGKDAHGTQREQIRCHIPVLPDFIESLMCFLEKIFPDISKTLK